MRSAFQPPVRRCHGLHPDDGRSAEQYQHAFARLYGAPTLAGATAALAVENPFYGLTALDDDLKALPAHQAKRRFCSAT
ncbi:MAG: hypothetical protein ACR5LG_14525 [Sodalis sp. (in: enterobacteria)]|uniref:hypothetical protein n=1 Tax=Sodalis sp. (in: enterobacteria) TaxID=1898979 RepID=UPI003F3849FF